VGWLVGPWLDAAINWLVAKVLAVLTGLWGLLSSTAFTTPDVTALPQVAAITSRSQAIVNVCFVLAVITAGITVMTHETLQVRYGVGELAPRLVIGWIAANFAIPLCRALIELANALTTALTGDGIASGDAFGQLHPVITDAMTNPASGLLLAIIGLVIAVLTAMLLATWLVRLGVLIVLVGIAPVALACHATPYTDGAARLWWRSFLGCLGTVVLQALALHTALSIFLSPQANLAALGLPTDPTGTINLFIVACLLWAVVKIPGLMRRYVTRGGQHSNAGLFLRMILIQAVSRRVQLPFGRRGGRAAAVAAGAGGRRSATATTAGGPSAANTVIPYWRPRLPRPAPGGTRTPPPATSSTTPHRGPSPAGGTSTTTGPTTGGRASTPASPSPGASSNPPPRSTRPPIRAAGLTPTPPPSGPRPVIPPTVNPTTAMPQTRPVRPPVNGPWNRPRPPRRS